MKHSLDKFRYCPCCGHHGFVVASEKSKKCEHCGFEYFMNAASANVALIFNDKGELLVLRRRYEPAKGTLDLPGGFADYDETAEEGVMREVKEETGMDVVACRYLFSKTNVYHYSGMDIRTLDLFFRCEVADTAKLVAMDDAAECMWLPLETLNIADFGLQSIREGLTEMVKNNS